MVMESNTPPDVAQKMDTDDLELPAGQVVVAYHERTKHHYHRYAASLGYLDWAKQPDPFRRYDGAPLVRLPLPEEGRALPFWQLYVADNVVPAPLVSLDMSNRMKVVDILLSDTFANYQKIILTHELGFFREFRRRIGSNLADWCFVQLQGNAAQNIQAKNEKSDLERAEDYLDGHDIEEAAMFLRKAAEDTAKRYREWAEGKALPVGEFFSLTQNLRAARNKLLGRIPTSVYEKVLKGTPSEHRELLVSADDTDLEGNGALQPTDRQKLKSSRNTLRNVLKHDGWAKMEAVEAVDRVLEMTDRVLNPASHGSTTPLYEEEVRRAKKLIVRLEKVLLEAQKVTHRILPKQF
jgi:hypothetical protein